MAQPLPITFADLPVGLEPLSLFDQQFQASTDGAYLKDDSVPLSALLTGTSGLAVGVAAFLGTPSSENFAAALTDKTGTGIAVFSNSPTLVTPALGTPSAIDLTNATGLPLAALPLGTDDVPIVGNGESASSYRALPLDGNGVTGLLPSDKAGAAQAATRAVLAGIDATKNTVAWLAEAGRQGWFQWNSANLSTEVTADTQQGIYVAPTSDTTGASGAWVRQYVGSAAISWWGALGNSVDDSQAFLGMATAKPPMLFIDNGNYYIDPITIDWRVQIAMSDGATISQRTTGVIGPPYVIPGQIITRQALFQFDAGSEYSKLTGGTFDGRRDDIAGFVDEYTSKWDAVDVFSTGVTLENVKAINFNTFPFSMEADYTTARDLIITDCGQGLFFGQFKAPTAALPGLPLGGYVGQSGTGIKVVDLDNQSASVFQHAIDIMYSHNGYFSNLEVANQSSTSGKSSTATGFTVLSCVQSKFEGIDHAGFNTTLPQLAMSFVGNIGCVFSNISIRGIGNGASCLGIEDISNEDCVISNYDIDGEYLANGSGLTYGVIGDIAAQYPQFNRARRRGLRAGRTQHVGGRIVRTSYGYYWRGGRMSVADCRIVGPTMNGILIDNWTDSGSFNSTAVAARVVQPLECNNITIFNPGLSGIDAHRYGSLFMDGIIVYNPGQSLDAAITNRSGINCSPVSQSGRVVIRNADIVDNQGVTISKCVTFSPGASGVGNKFTLTMLNSNQIDYNQHFLILDGGGTGIDIDCWVTDIVYDEATVQAATSFSLSSSGNTTALSGTWTTDATDDTQLNGSGGAALSEVPGAIWITNGSEWRQVFGCANNNTIYLNAAFSTPLSGATLNYVSCDVQLGPAGAPSMQIGFRLSTGNVDTILTQNCESRGATTQDWLVNNFDKFEANSQYQYETGGPVTITTSPFPLLPGPLPTYHSIVGVAMDVTTILAGSGLTTWSVLVQSSAGSTIETVQSAIAIAAGTKIRSAVAAQSRSNSSTSTQRKIGVSADAGTFTSGAIKAKALIRVDAPNSY